LAISEQHEATAHPHHGSETRQCCVSSKAYTVDSVEEFRDQMWQLQFQLWTIL